MTAQPPNLSPTEHSSSTVSRLPSPSQQEDSEPPLPLLDSTENIEIFYAKQEQKMPVVVAMSVGLPDGKGVFSEMKTTSEQTPDFPQKIGVNGSRNKVL